MKSLSFLGLMLMAASSIIAAVTPSSKKGAAINNGKLLQFQGHLTCRPATVAPTCVSTAFVVSNDAGTTVA